MVRQMLVDVVEEINYSAIRLKQLFQFTEDEAINFLANAGVLKNEMCCDNCGNNMNIQKRSGRQDGIRVNF
jgi:uncharacterized protein YaaW (UPF0174 family)